MYNFEYIIPQKGLSKAQIKKINNIGIFIKQNKTICNIQGFKSLIKDLNSEGQGIEDGLNCVATIINFFNNKNISIERVNVKNNPKGSNPDIIFSYNNSCYTVEIETVARNELDEILSREPYRGNETVCKFLTKSIVEIPQGRRQNIKESKNIYIKLSDIFKKIISQFNVHETNIVILLTDAIRIEWDDFQDAIIELERAYASIKENRIIDENKLLQGRFSKDEIIKFHDVKKIIVFSGCTNPPNYIFPRLQDAVQDQNLISFLSNTNFKECANLR